MSALTLSRVTDERGLIRWHEVTRASLDADFEALPADPIEDIRPALTELFDGEQVELWVGDVEAGRSVEAVGSVVAVELGFPVQDNLSLAKLNLHVHPDHRHAGLGRQATEMALELIRERGRTTVLAEVPMRTRSADPSPGEDLARSLGWRPMLAERRRLLDVYAMPQSALESQLADARTASTGYSTVAWRNRAPAEYVEDMAALQALMSTDAPQGELVLDPEVWDAARYLEREDGIQERGRTQLLVAARHDATGRLAGFSDIGVPAGATEIGYQWSTIVRSEHRGHRLGRLLKLANLAELRKQMPGVRCLNTWNADDNRYMVAVNEELGFRVMEGWSEWQLDLAGQPADRPLG